MDKRLNPYVPRTPQSHAWHRGYEFQGAILYQQVREEVQAAFRGAYGDDWNISDTVDSLDAPHWDDVIIAWNEGYRAFRIAQLMQEQEKN